MQRFPQRGTHCRKIGGCELLNLRVIGKLPGQVVPGDRRAAKLHLYVVSRQARKGLIAGGAVSLRPRLRGRQAMGVAVQTRSRVLLIVAMSKP